MPNKNSTEAFMEQQHFEQCLLQALKKKYGKKPTARQLSLDLYKISDGQVNVSGESVRKWLTGVSFPRGEHLIALMRLLDAGQLLVPSQKSFSESLVTETPNQPPRPIDSIHYKTLL
jgi:hypothetical protein